VAGGPAPGAGGNAADPAGAAASVAAFGGNATGRASKVKFPAGTPEGDEERRRDERERKAAARAVARKMVEPPTLPSAAPGVADSVPQKVPVQFGGDGAEVSAPPVLWQPDTLTDLVSELLDAAEAGRVASFAAKCQEGGLMPKLCREIEADAHFPKTAKIILKRSLPRLAAKWMNKAGISAEFQDEVAVLTAMLLILQHDRKMSGKLDELIASNKQRSTAPPAATTAGVVTKPGVKP
jgi:hypothetical protein